MANPTTNLGMTKPTVGGSTDTWGTTLNEEVVDILDALFSISGTDVTMSDIKFNSMSVQETGAGTDTVKIQAPAAVTTAYTLTMPAAVGSTNQVLSAADGSGTLAWTTPETGDITAIVAGAGLTGTSLSGPIPTLNVIGTADKVTVSADAVTIASTYVGQTSITTLGTIATGVWNGTAITGAYIDPTSSPLASTKIWIGSGSNVAAEFALSGNATMTAGGVVTVSTAAACSGLAATATALASARNIGGVSFDGTGNIDLPGVNTAGNQDTSGTAADATVLETARTIGGTSFNGSANIAVALSATATALATARAINGTDFDGTAAITVTAAAGTLTGATLNSGVTASSLTSLGTIASLVATKAEIFVSDASQTPDTSADELTIESSGAAGISILTGTSNVGAIMFGDSGDNGRGKVTYNHSSDLLQFTSGGSVAMSMDEDQKVGIGTDDPDQQLHVLAGGSVAMLLEASAGSACYLMFQDNTSSDSQQVRVGSVGDGMSLWAGDTERMTIASGGTVNVVGTFTAGTKTFKIDHPLPDKTDSHHLIHSCIEGPRADLIYRGTVDLSGGSAQVDLDEAAGMTEGTFEVLCRDSQCFVQNDSGWDAVRGGVEGNTLTIECEGTSSSDTVSWMVVAERCDPHIMAAESTDDDGHVIVEPEKEEDGA